VLAVIALVVMLVLGVPPVLAILSVPLEFWKIRKFGVV
jgi:hypothetical protein